MAILFFPCAISEGMGEFEDVSWTKDVGEMVIGLASNQALPALGTSHATCCYWRQLLGIWKAFPEQPRQKQHVVWDIPSTGKGWFEASDGIWVSGQAQ